MLLFAIATSKSGVLDLRDLAPYMTATRTARLYADEQLSLSTPPIVVHHARLCVATLCGNQT